MRLLLLAAQCGVHPPTRQQKEQQRFSHRQSTRFCSALSSSSQNNNDLNFIQIGRIKRRHHQRVCAASESNTNNKKNNNTKDDDEMMMKSKKKSPKQKKELPKDVVFEYLNESTKFVVSATAMVFLMFHPTVETCWCLLGSIVNSVNGKLLKRALNHSRPDGAKKVDPGMPSSHATSLSYLSWYAALAFAFEPNAFGLATFVTRTLAFGLVSLGAFLAYLRVKLGFHTWPQVYVGYGLGSSTALVWILFGKGYLIQHLARHPERLKNLHACLVVAIGLFALSAIKWVKELVKSSSSKSKKQSA
jgi:dolichyldiphosphatase